LDRTNYLTTFDSKLQHFMTKKKAVKRIPNPDFTSVTVKLIPKDLIQHVIRIQSEIKLQKCSGQYSLSAAIVTILREHRDSSKKVISGLK
jgi:hypothetical protein